MQLVIDGWRIDVAARTAKRGEHTALLSPRAIRLLQVLAEANGATVSRGHLLDRVWPNVFVGDESLTQVVAEVRRSLKNREIIATISRGGYRLTVPVQGFNHAPAEPSALAGQALTIDAYTLCIEAIECYARAAENADRTCVDLTAQAVALAPDCADARAFHAAFLLKKHMLWSEGEMLMEKALAEVEVALALQPDHAAARFIGGTASLLGGFSNLGMRDIEMALMLAPGDAAMHSEAGSLLLGLGNSRAAKALAIRSASLDPTRFGDEMFAARLLWQCDPARARPFAERALRKVQAELSIDPHSMTALYCLGPLLALLGDKAGARAALEGVAHHNTPLEFFRALGFAMIGDVSSSLERLGFLAMRGWRFGCVLDKDDGLSALLPDPRFKRLHSELLAA